MLNHSERTMRCRAYLKKRKPDSKKGCPRQNAERQPFFDGLFSIINLEYALWYAIGITA